MILTAVAYGFIFYLGIGTGLYLVARKRGRCFSDPMFGRVGAEFMLFLELTFFWLLMLAFGLGVPELTGTEQEEEQKVQENDSEE